MNYLLARSSVISVDLPRSKSTNMHPDSSYPWWQMDGREYLESVYPDNSEIWHSLSAPKRGRYKLWQYDEDINSRPLFAKHIGTDALFSLHTNASINPSISGTRAFVALNRPEDLDLANEILCGMKELIHAQDAYASFNVASQAQASDKYGENTLAIMPAVVLEVAFHTNASDAAALQDPVFMDAAMKGAEKGFRLHAEGKICKPFKNTSFPDVTFQRPGAQIIPVNFEGFPYFPVTLVIENVTCAPGNTCNGGSGTINEPQDSPFQIQMECTGTSETTDTSRFSVKLTDVDSVEASAFEFALTCLPNAGATAKDRPSVRAHVTSPQ